MYMLKGSIEKTLSKSISFFQGIFAGMALLFTITLNLSQSVSRELVRVEDQSIRVISLLTTLGSFFSMLRARDRRTALPFLRRVHKTAWDFVLDRLTLQVPGLVHHRAHILYMQLHSLQYKSHIRSAVQYFRHQLPAAQCAHHCVHGTVSNWVGCH